jgi:hypothetical protein
MTPARRELYGLGLIWALVLAYALFALGCATVPTRASIAANLDACLRSRVAFAPHLELACECPARARAACLAAGWEAGCAWDGWNDRDRDAWTLAACEQRRTAP